MHVLISALMHGGNRQTSTTAPRYLSILNAEAVMEVVTAVAMGSEEEYKTQCLSITRWGKDGGSATRLSRYFTPSSAPTSITCFKAMND